MVGCRSPESGTLHCPHAVGPIHKPSMLPLARSVHYSVYSAPVKSDGAPVRAQDSAGSFDLWTANANCAAIDNPIIGIPDRS